MLLEPFILVLGNFTCLEVVFKLKRRIGYYVFHTYVPTCLIVIMSVSIIYNIVIILSNAIVLVPGNKLFFTVIKIGTTISKQKLLVLWI